MESGTAAASPVCCAAVLGTIMRRSICVPRIATTGIPRIETTTTASVLSWSSVPAARHPAFWGFCQTPGGRSLPGPCAPVQGSYGYLTRRSRPRGSMPARQRGKDAADGAAA